MVITQSGKEGSVATGHSSRKRMGLPTPRHQSNSTTSNSYHFNKEQDGSIDGSKPNSIKTIRSESPTTNDVMCRGCDKPIMGLIVQALGDTWHQDHFLCTECKKPISSNRFNVEQGKPYCEDDYANLFLKKCHGCKAPIRDVVVVALNQTWHRDHFVCITCGTKLSNKGFFERENNPFCQRCYEEKFCPKCNGCTNPITDTAVMALGKKWHQDCFKCKNCLKPITDSTFEVVTNRPVCAPCVKFITKNM